MAAEAEPARSALLRRGLVLEYVTLGWNVAGIAVLAFAAITARSVALAGFGLDSLIEIGASVVVIWELSGTGQRRRRRALRLDRLRARVCPILERLQAAAPGLRQRGVLPEFTRVAGLDNDRNLVNALGHERQLSKL